jgi:hypothetical protein
MTGDWRDEPVNQFALPWASAPGETAERVLHVSELEEWVARRGVSCGHPEPTLSQRVCLVCHGTVRVTEAFLGSDRVRVLPGA